MTESLSAKCDTDYSNKSAYLACLSMRSPVIYCICEMSCPSQCWLLYVLWFILLGCRWSRTFTRCTLRIRHCLTSRRMHQYKVNVVHSHTYDKMNSWKVTKQQIQQSITAGPRKTNHFLWRK